MPTKQAPAPETDEPLGMRWGPGLVAAIIFFVAIAILWVGLAGVRLFGGSPSARNPDYLDDRAYVEALQERCATLRLDLAELPRPEQTPNASARADVIAEATDLVREFVDELEAGAPTTGDAAISVRGWVGDWRTYVANRDDYVERLREDPDARFLLDESELGDSVDQTIRIFADVNGMPSCATPGDIG